MKPQTCCAGVPMRLNFYRTRPCGCPAKVERDGKPYCGRHDPVAKAERAAKLEPQREATRERQMALFLNRYRKP